MQNMIFNAWCILINGMLYYAEADFLLRFTKKHDRGLILHYVIVNSLLTVMAIWTQMFLVFGILHIAVLFLFSVLLFRIPVKGVVTPAIIIFTLSTFREGFVAVLMQFLSRTLNSQAIGAIFQFALPAILGGLFFLTLRLIAKKYLLLNSNLVSSYLYILLLPGALIIGGIRTSLGLNSSTGVFSQGAWVGNNLTSALYAVFWMLGALLVFFIIIEVVYKITLLSGKELERELLEREIKEQRGYIDEARQRNEGYRSFQHDINNHLLVLSGLLSFKQYPQAETYLQKLNQTAGALSEEIATGNSILDVLLWEKIRYARQRHITVTCDVQIPKESLIDDIDLCILFANGMDNAIKASLDVDMGHRTITLAARPRHTFLLIEISNKVKHADPLIYGTGLKNIELTAEKYAGTIHIEQSQGCFSLSILLCYKK